MHIYDRSIILYYNIAYVMNNNIKLPMDSKSIDLCACKIVESIFCNINSYTNYFYNSVYLIYVLNEYGTL